MKLSRLLPGLPPPDLLKEIRLLRRHLVEHPEDLRGWLVLGSMEKEEELFAAAMDSFGRGRKVLDRLAGRLAPADRWTLDLIYAEIDRSVAGTADRAGDPERAISELHRALERDPDPTAFFDLGHLLEDQGQMKEARRAYRTVLGWAPDHVEAMHRLGWMDAWQRPRRAMRWFRRALRVNPGHGPTLCSFGFVLSALGRYEKAESLLRRATLRPRAGARPWVYLGHCYSQQQRSDDALAAYRKAADLDPRDPLPRFALGDEWLQRGEPRRAFRAYREALAIDPACADAFLRLGMLLADDGRGGVAVRCLRRAVELAPGHPRAAEARARAEELAGRGEGASVRSPDAA